MRSAALHAAPVPVGADPFSRRAVFLLLGLGTALFVLLLWLVGTGLGSGSTNDGQAHVGGRGLNGYAAMAQYLEARGYTVVRSQNKGDLAKPGLLVLTPPADAKGKDIDKIVAQRRHIGPTLIIAPKWQAMEARKMQGGWRIKRGWVRLGGVGLPQWDGFLDQIGVELNPARPGARWSAKNLSAPLAAPRVVESGAGTGLVRLVAGAGDRYTLAGFMDDGGSWPGLEAMALDRVLHSGEAKGLQPVVLVFEPDLLDNYGFAHVQNAQLAEALVRASGVAPGGTITFDMTLNGYGRTQNLLTLAFEPPFLAATLCLLMAAGLIGWRALLRFGPPLTAARPLAFGKRALVVNTAGMIRRSRRLHLLGRPYAERMRRRLANDLGLRLADPATTDAMIDAALVAKGAADGGQASDTPFSDAVARLEGARGDHAILSAARAIHALERTILR
ncbi:DUF4350 domain-containing protein [Novosphingobium sp. 9]|uniref:DUF4350 domain-containing protein n=1 Tax=Novosphingobium sp. 9 TaxID=2025349 RepID=UPI0021B523D6|nr:DUF4350 domain-containing protein [Novosphingobium sp. 9]